MRLLYATGNTLKTSLRVLIPSVALGLIVSAPTMAETVVPLAPFRSVTLHNGGHVVLRHGPTQRVTLIKGSTDHTRLKVADGGRLVIDDHSHSPRGYRLEVEILTPEIVEVSVEDGGLIQTRGSFPRQAELDVAVDNGGIIDLRSMTVDVVNAEVEQGGGIFTKPQRALNARITQGGAITYWGSPQVKSSVQHGGAVSKGRAADADRPLSELGPGLQDVRALPPVPPVPSKRGRGSI